MTVPRILIAGTHSGCGKTTVASGIMAALVARGLKVQPFKVGPDFIDPSHHTSICGRSSRNLDPFMMGEDGCASTFSKATADADIAVIEGVMGMFDGIDGSDLASTAHVARILKAPVILVVDAKGMSRSVHALVKGFREYDPSLDIAGIIVNRIGSPRHRNMIESSLQVPAFGWIPKREEIAVGSRHLGLVMAHESGVLNETGRLIEEFCNIGAITAAAGTAPPLVSVTRIEQREPVRSRIGVAMDSAFCFYYQDNLDHLRAQSAELVFFSPLSDRLPDVDGVYLGGGYPELHLNALETCRCRDDIRCQVDKGMPLYAECGGLMYLTREITAEKTYRMAGVLPAVSEMTGRVQALGYVRGEAIGNRSFVSGHQEILGHEFHYSRIVPDNDVRYAFRLSRGKGISGGQDGLIAHNALGLYTHSYFSPAFVKDFLHAAARFSRE
jgi:cobyrinic acid a,c-diamide synthase